MFLAMEINKETNKVEEILKSFPRQRSEIIKALHQLQDANAQNYISEEVIEKVAKHFKLKKAEVYGIVTYYSMYSVEPRGKYLVRICKSPICMMKGTQEILDFFEKEYGIKPNRTTADGLITLETAECLGQCDNAPSMMINKEVYTDLTFEKIKNIISKLK